MRYPLSFAGPAPCPRECRRPRPTVNNFGYTILTGVTALLGRYLLRDLTLRGLPLAVVARPKGRESAEARVDAPVARWEAGLGLDLERPVCLAGDVTEPGLGLARDDRRWAADQVVRVL